MVAASLVGRDEEFGLIDGFLSDVRFGPTALVLAGEPGIGKTALWDAGIERARGVGHTMVCRGVEAEALLSFAALSELLSPVLADVLGSLAPPRRKALEVALLLEDPGERSPDAHAVGLAVLDVLCEMAKERPVVVAIDDIQWMDSASASVLQIALRRLRDEPVSLLVTVRGSPDAVSPIELERCFADDRLYRVSLGPLGLGALYHLLRDRLGLDLSRPQLMRIEEATGGNPFFALEVGRELILRGTRVEPGELVPAPNSLRRMLGARLSRLSTRTRDVLLITAAAGRPTIDVVAKAHGERAAAIESLDEAQAEGIVMLFDGRVQFAHPLFASVLYEEVRARQRQDVHRALAGVVGDIEERARHLARAAAGVDAHAAVELETAAEHAAARGATAAGAEMYELAAALTFDPAGARRRRLRAAALHSLAGDGQRAVALLDQLLVSVPHGPERADVLLELVSTLRSEPMTMIDLLSEALVEAADDDSRCVHILCKRTWAHLFDLDARAALLDARDALGRAERAADARLLAIAIHSVGQAEMWTGDVTPGLLERGVDIEKRYGVVVELMSSPRSAYARRLVRQGEIERPRRIYEDLEKTASIRGDERSRVIALWMLATVEWLAGEWQVALGHCVTARELGEQTQAANERAWVGRMKAVVETDLGLVADARASGLEGLAISEATANAFFEIASLGALGRLELALGNLDSAASFLAQLPARLLQGGFNEPTNAVWADSIETLVGLGRLEQAESYLDDYEANARSFGSPWAIAAAARCRGIFALQAGDSAAAIAQIERALAVLDEYPYPLERGRSLLVMGSLRRQAQQKGAARAALEEALAIFEQLGARLWADKARSEVARISGRRPAHANLTETERRVAVLAAEGRSNRQIAAALYMGVSTVEAHLSHIYRKLGVRRVGLAAVVADQADDPVSG
jgi:DNA-binding CsgD family transcriptional regulator